MRNESHIRVLRPAIFDTSSFVSLVLLTLRLVSLLLLARFNLLISLFAIDSVFSSGFAATFNSVSWFFATARSSNFARLLTSSSVIEFPLTFIDVSDGYFSAGKLMSISELLCKSTLVSLGKL